MTLEIPEIRPVLTLNLTIPVMIRSLPELARSRNSRRRGLFVSCLLKDHSRDLGLIFHARRKSEEGAHICPLSDKSRSHAGVYPFR